ncbi:MAG: hypothetical protein A3I05_03480 [Deltaproteobacteria bacterium RIFCSPLOWO2_02_FULL_44_10]|nr:MAG: hypothetical protein A3C46_03055 [Deltaproteobacteria bacterium RIFCSPHIGHO2_02_FULL_44_16]OGQ46234.1 MAG: hypothetical protein A3I05_03480 [Deltaproteobacteria bacterium RIFCSPLOWO2_02_FULL_44_10]
MPIYEYQCEKCSKAFERFQKITDLPLTICPDCQGAVKRIVSRTSFTLKGGGWYKDGYGSSAKKETETAQAEKKTPEKKKEEKKSTGDGK